jgi:hypothetical protein
MSTRKHAVSEERKAEVVAEVLGRMADGQTVKEAVSAMKLDVSDGTVRRWMTEREEWAGDYQRAKKLMASAMAEEALRVARESTNYSSAADRVLIETLKWAAGKANPAEYGDRQTVEHQGAQTLQVKIVEDDVPVKNVMALNDTAKEVVSGAIMQIAVQTPLQIAGGED